MWWSHACKKGISLEIIVYLFQRVISLVILAVKGFNKALLANLSLTKTNERNVTLNNYLSFILNCRGKIEIERKSRGREIKVASNCGFLFSLIILTEREFPVRRTMKNQISLKIVPIPNETS